MYEFLKGFIRTGNYVLSDMETRIKHLYVTGDLTEEQVPELLKLAADNASDAANANLYDMIVDLTRRVDAIESKGITVWTSQNNVTAKGQTRLYDIDKDGALDYVRYDGGRSSTALSPGKIEGWVKTDASGNVTHTISRDASGNIVLTPYVEPEPEPEPVAEEPAESGETEGQ